LFGIWLFAVPWTAFALFWESMVAGPLIMHLLGYEVSGKMPTKATMTGLWVMALFGLPFVLVGFGMLAAPFYAMRKGAKTFYVLTNKRIAILEGGQNVTVTSIPPSEIGPLSRKEGPDGRGTLTISQGYGLDSDGDRFERKQELGVINDVRRVEQLVRDLKERTAA
jgi:hypothetical protein